MALIMASTPAFISPQFLLVREPSIIAHTQMANNTTQNNAPDILGGAVEVTIGGVVEVTSPLVGESLVSGLLRNFSTSSQLHAGDYLMDRSRALLHKHFQLMEVKEQKVI